MRKQLQYCVMLVLTRKPGERIVVGNAYQIEVVSAERGVVTLALHVDQPLTLMPGNVRIEAVADERGGVRPIRVSRKVDDSVIIGDDLERQIEVLVVSVKGEAVRVGVKAPRDVQVHRQEVFELIERENIAAAQAAKVDVRQMRRLLDAKEPPPSPGEQVETQAVKAPAGGTISALHVASGDSVTAGQAVATLMSGARQFNVAAPKPGVVRLQVGEGDKVRSGQTIAEIE